jgi:hypothetical protein
MASKNRCRLVQPDAKPALKLMPAPRSSQDVVMLLKMAAHLGLANAKIVAHLTEMGALFPKELLGAFKAFQERQACDN